MKRKKRSKLDHIYIKFAINQYYKIAGEGFQNEITYYNIIIYRESRNNGQILVITFSVQFSAKLEKYHFTLSVPI